MKPVDSWNIRTTDPSKTINLYKNKLVVIKHFHRDDYKQTFTFNEILNYKYTITSAEIDCQILKKMVMQEKPNNLNVFEEKVWSFWSGFHNNDIEEERIFVDEHNFLFKSKFGFAWGHFNTFTEKESIYSWQRHDNFFFFGPYLYGVKLSDRKSLKKKIFSLIDNKRSKISLNDGFLLFDYDQIQEVELEKIDGITGIYFKIIDGKVIVGGWDNPRDGGENYSSVEYLWYNMKERLQSEFYDKIPYIIHTLEKAIVDEAIENNPNLKTSKDSLMDGSKPGSA